MRRDTYGYIIYVAIEAVAATCSSQRYESYPANCTYEWLSARPVYTVGRGATGNARSSTGCRLTSSLSRQRNRDECGRSSCGVVREVSADVPRW